MAKAIALGVPPPANTIAEWQDWLSSHGNFSNKTRGNAVLWEFEFNKGREYPSQKIYTYDDKDENAHVEVIRKAIEDLFEFRKKR